jgi:hypothetical protein
MLMIVVSSQMKSAETQELGDLIFEQLPINYLIHGAFLPALFRL